MSHSEPARVDVAQTIPPSPRHRVRPKLGTHSAKRPLSAHKCVPRPSPRGTRGTHPERGEPPTGLGLASRQNPTPGSQPTERKGTNMSEAASLVAQLVQRIGGDDKTKRQVVSSMTSE
jgi:hypothetical protein